MKNQTFTIKQYNNNTILIWPWDSAPESLKILSHHGGDEDWVAWVPNSYRQFVSYDDGVLWSNVLPRASCDCQEIEFLNGAVYISAHA